MDIKLVRDPDACVMYMVSPLGGLGGGILRRPPNYSLMVGMMVTVLLQASDYLGDKEPSLTMY